MVATSMVSSNGSIALQANMRAQSAYESSHMGQTGMAAGHPHQLVLMKQQQAASVAGASRRTAGVRQPAVPQPVQPRATPSRRTSQAYADFEYEEAEVSIQTSKSGRVRKVGWCRY
jgi:hypothetical protein